MFHYKVNQVDEACDSSPECLLTSEPVRDPYSTDEEGHRVMKDNKKNKKFLSDDVISTSQVQPIELCSFLDFKFHQVVSTASIIQCSIEELVMESFKFVFPNGVPEYYFKYYYTLEHCSWADVATKLCTQFFNQPNKKWLKDNFMLDYTDIRLAQFLNQQDVIDEALKSTFADQHGYDIGMLNTISLANEMHIMFDYLARDKRHEGLGDCSNSKADICSRRDMVINMVYKMITFLGISCRVHSAAKYEFYHPVLPGRKHGGVVVKSQPDLTVCIDIPGGHYPYCAIQVHGQSSEEKLQAVNTSEESSHSQKSGDNDDPEFRLDNLTLSDLKFGGNNILHESSGEASSDKSTACSPVKLNKNKKSRTNEKSRTNSIPLQTVPDSSRTKTITYQTDPDPSRTKTITYQTDPDPSRTKTITYQTDPDPSRTKTITYQTDPDPSRTKTITYHADPDPSRTKTITYQTDPDPSRTKTITYQTDPDPISRTSPVNMSINEKPFLISSRTAASPLRKEPNKIISISSAELISELSKCTAQLHLDMYGQLVQQEEIRQGAYGDWFTNRRDKNCETVGLFINNEYIYLQKIEQESSVVRLLAQKKVSYVVEGPSVYLADWGFDLKKPNHRLAFLVFMFYHREMVVCDSLTNYLKQKTVGSQ